MWAKLYLLKEYAEAYEKKMFKQENVAPSGFERK